MVDDPLNARTRETSFGFPDLMMFLKRRWLLIMFCALALFVATGAWLSTIQTRYTATAELTLIDQRQQSTPIADLLSGVPLSRQLVEQEVTTMRSKAFLIEVIKRIDAQSDLSILGPPITPTFPERVIDSIKDFVLVWVRPEPSYQNSDSVAEEPETETIATTLGSVTTIATEPADDDVNIDQEAAFVVLAEDLERYGDDADYLGGLLNISQRGNSYVIGISAQTVNPAHAAEIANAVATEYTRFSLAIRGDALGEQVELLSGRVDELGNALQAAETAVVDFQENVMGINNFTDDRLAGQIIDMSRRQIEARAEVVRAQAQYEKAKSDIDSLGAIEAAAVLNSPILANVRAELSQLRIDRSRVTERFGAESTQVAAVDAVIDRIYEEIEIETGRVLSELQTELSIRETTETSINAELLALEEAMLARSRDMVELAKLQRIADANRIAYEEFLNIATESEQYQALQQPTVRLLSYAEVPEGPSSPRYLVMLAIAGTAGFLIGLGLAILREAVDNRIKTVPQLRRVSGLPVIGSLSMIGRVGARRLSQRINSGQDTPLHRDEQVLVGESNATVSFLLNMIDHKSGTVVVTSAVPGEGASTVAFLIADTLSRRGESVLLIDTSTKKAIAEADLKGGVLVDIEETTEIVKRESGIHTLSLSGATQTDPDALSEDLRSILMKKIVETYDYVIIDTPPILSSSVGLRFLRDADATVVASRWNATPRQTIEACAQMLSDLNAQRTCMVMTNVKRREEQKYEYAGFKQVSQSRRVRA